MTKQRYSKLRIAFDRGPGNPVEECRAPVTKWPGGYPVNEVESVSLGRIKQIIQEIKEVGLYIPMYGSLDWVPPHRIVKIAAMLQTEEEDGD